jgi:hypothetical protein
MTEAKNLLDSQQLEGLAAAVEASNVVQLFGPARTKPPPLSDEEVEQLRFIIRAFQAISQTCPIARKITTDLPP